MHSSLTMQFWNWYLIFSTVSLTFYGIIQSSNSKKSKCHWRIQGGATDEPPPGPNIFIFMQFWGKLGKIIGWSIHLYGWRPLLWEILDPPLQHQRKRFNVIFNIIAKLLSKLLPKCHRWDDDDHADTPWEGTSIFGLSSPNNLLKISCVISLSSNCSILQTTFSVRAL